MNDSYEPVASATTLVWVSNVALLWIGSFSESKTHSGTSIVRVPNKWHLGSFLEKQNASRATSTVRLSNESLLSAGSF